MDNREAERRARRYRGYCDPCGRNLGGDPADLGTTRVRADRHARRWRHAVRIEPEFGFDAVETRWPPQRRPSDGP